MEQLEKQEAERLLAVQHMLQAGDMKAFRSEFLENHTYDQAQLYLALTAEERMQVYNYLSAVLPQVVAHLGAKRDLQRLDGGQQGASKPVVEIV